VVNPGRRAKRFEGTIAGIEKAGVGYDVADPLRRSDNLGIASGIPQDAKDSGVKDGCDLGQPSGDRHFSDAQNELVQGVVDAAAVSFRLAARRGSADARTSPDGGALNSVAVEQLRKTSRSMFGPVVGSSLSEPQ
jgi:hypothetical protein